MNPHAVTAAALLALPTGAVTAWGVPTAPTVAGPLAALGAAWFGAAAPDPRAAAWRASLPLAAALVLAPYARFALAGTALPVFVVQAVATKVAAGAVLTGGYRLAGIGGGDYRSPRT